MERVQMSDIKFSRHWAMPSRNTFSVPVIGQFVSHYLNAAKISVDPFARNCRWFTHTNDLNPETAAENHLEAREFLRSLRDRGIRADLLICDPPYSPRQIVECYAVAGLKPTMVDTQSARLMSEVRELLEEIATDDAVCLSFGWSSVGMGKGWSVERIMLVSHGGAHNDTICMAERRRKPCKDQSLLDTLERVAKIAGGVDVYA
jgi:hypothetical protein